MTEDEQAKEFLTKSREVETLQDSLRRLHKKRGRFKTELKYIHEYLDRHYSEEGLNSGAVGMPALEDWPDKDELKNLFIKLQETNQQLRSTKHRLDQLKNPRGH